ncbi:pyridoxal-dependent decarboxylase [Truncatella angustata]|uniref:Pyridoxal-dependent decarboxylase n=1 Tax=Truncatella angustata TaxID=152316 RepID=A0A9P8UIM7_9PEZI|nr:pyridoxal-dependent decarboxylase [Truncatella angustata]KAH6652760.1 pyridoxal-dependent decarboxylase [Truncatella angustata]
MSTTDDDFLLEAYKRIWSVLNQTNALPVEVLPKQAHLAAARASLPQPTGDNYLTEIGRVAALDHLLRDIAPALNGQNRSGRYYGFVTGSTLPIAEAADNLVTAYDQNVQVHLPTQTIATEVEDAALKMLITLLDLGDAADWQGRTLTTGATASNILGLGCAREAVVQARLPEGMPNGVGELGLLAACNEAGIRDVQILTSMGHSSLYKAASIVGLGRHSVKDLPYSDDEPWRLDLHMVERELQREGVASIIALSAGEVNTGRFATTGIEDMRRLRDLADRYKAWIHVDGAFGVFARCLPRTSEYSKLQQYAAGLELADSITVDGHKLLNVPYDCGMFFTRKASALTSWCQNPNAAYLAGGATDGIQSPLNVGLQNSRRFRALPVYAVLLSEGREGIARIMERMVHLARGVAEAVRESPDYILLPDENTNAEDTHVVVLFRAKDDDLNERLVETIHKSGQWYVSGTKWKGQTAVRVAVSTWRVNVDEDLRDIKSYLASMAEDHKNGI